MRVSIFILTAVFAVIANLAGTSAEAGWKSSVLGDSINPPVTAPSRAAKKRVYKQRKTKRTYSKKIKFSKSKGKSS